MTCDFLRKSAESDRILLEMQWLTDPPLPCWLALFWCAGVSSQVPRTGRPQSLWPRPASIIECRLCHQHQCPSGRTHHVVGSVIVVLLP